MRWRDVSEDMERIGFAAQRSRYLEVGWYDGNDERRWSIVNLDGESVYVTVVVGAEMDDATERELVSDVRGRLKYRDDLTIAQEFERAQKIAASLRKTLHGGRAA